MVMVVRGNQDDNIQTGSGNDVIQAGNGNNTVNAGDGTNVISAGTGNDVITSGSGNDTISAGNGHNVVNAGGGNNQVASGTGNDIITTGSGNDAIYAGDGNNRVNAGDGLNLVVTGRGNDEVVGGSGNDIVDTGAGDDFVSLGGGNNIAHLGAGNDTVNFVWQQNVNSINAYFGQGGHDTFRIVLTAAEAQNAAIVADILAFKAHLASGANTPYVFSTIALTAAQFESVVIIAPVVASDDTASSTEDGAATIINVLANDEDLLAGGNGALAIVGYDASSLPSGSSLVLNPDKTFTFDPGTAFQDLAAGQQLQVQFTYTVADDQGFEAVGTVTITITGTNDGPTVTSSPQAGAVDEVADNVAGENATTHAQSGAVVFSDVDTLDTHTASFVPQGSGYLGSFVLAALDQDANSVGWSFSLDDSAIDHLQAGQVLTQSYVVTVDDGHGGTAQQTVTITITGTNDGPMITSSAQAGTVTEIGDNAAGENATTHAQSGAVAFGDVDTLDTHTASFAPQGSGYLGSFVLAALDQDANSVGWSFSLDDSAIDHLQAGQVVTQTYVITVDDGHGGTAQQTVTITITGTNDAPLVTSGRLVTNENTATSGTLAGSDEDNGDVIVFSLVDGPAHGTVIINPDGSYEYMPASGFAGMDSFTFVATDQSGAVSNTGTIVIDVDEGGEGQVSYIGDLIVDEQVSTGSNSFNSEVAALSGGGHVVVWSSYNQAPDYSGYGVFAQRYDANGEKIGGQFLVNATVASDQFYAGVAGLTGGALDGGFVVVWMSYTQDTSGYGIYAQRYDAGGTAVGGEILVNATTSSDQLYSSVTALANGQFAVTWQDPNGDGWDVYLRVFNADGTAATGEILANQTTVNSQETDGFIAETITTLADGGFVVSWRCYDGTYDVFARVFNADGTARSDEFRVHDIVNGHQFYASVGALVGADGGFVVTWSDPDSTDGSGWGIFAQRYDADGNAIGDAFEVNSYTYSTQVHSKAVGLSDGGFVIVWQSHGADGNSSGISGQRYDASGNANGGEFIVNSDVGFAANQYEPSIDLRADGALIVTWAADGRIEQKIITDFDVDTRPVNADEQVSTGNNSHGSEVAALSGGGHVVVWSAYYETPDNNGYGVFAQRYDANGEKIGTEFLVNTTTASHQYYAGVAGLTGDTLDGGFVVVWMSYNQDGSGWGIYAQRYDAGGAAVGGEILVNATTSSEQLHASVTALANGQFAVTWQSYDQDGSEYGVYLRVFNDDGTAATGEILVNQTTANWQETDGHVAETITTLDDGGFVVSWRSYDGTYDVFARVFNADGTARSDEFRVHDIVNGHQFYASVGALVGAAGGFVVTWSDGNSGDGSGWGVFAQLYDADGNTIGDAFEVNSYTYSTQIHSKAVGLSDGGFVIVWQSYGADGNSSGISGQRYDASGNATGGEFIVNSDVGFAANQYEPSIDLRADGALIVTWAADGRIEQKIITDFDTDTRPVNVDEQVSTTGNSKTGPEVAALSGGGHVVVWSAYYETPDNNGYGVFAQRYDANGEKIGTEFLVNTTTASEQLYAGVAGLTGDTLDGGFVVVWMSYNQDGSGWGIYAQRYDAGGAAVGGEILVNATTSSEQLHASVTALANGQFAVTWQSYDQDGSEYGVYLRVFNDDGTAATGEILVNQTTANWQETDGHVAETITTLDDGGFVVSWRSYDGTYDVFARVFNADGTARSDEFRVHDIVNGHQFYASVGALVGAAGGFVVTWSDGNSGDGSGWGVFAQLYDADGNTIGDAFEVNSYTYSTQIHSKAVGLSDGGFVIVWQSHGVDGSSWGISGQRYDASGNAVGGEFIINSDVGFGANQYEPSIDLRADGALVVAWTTEGNRIEQKIITDFDSGAVEAKSLLGTSGNDSLIGSDFADTIDGAGGDDRLSGLDGADQFIFREDDGTDTITDFEVGTDSLVFEAGLTVAALSESDADGDGSTDTVIDTSDGDQIILLDVTGVTDHNNLFGV